MPFEANPIGEPNLIPSARRRQSVEPVREVLQASGNNSKVWISSSRSACSMVPFPNAFLTGGTNEMRTGLSYKPRTRRILQQLLGE